MEMVEKVARAMQDKWLHGEEISIATGKPVPKEERTQWKMFVPYAAAAIEAMLEPSDEMIAAGVETDDDFSEAAPEKACIMIWRAMLGAALKEQE